MRGKQLITTLMVAAAVVVLVFATTAAIDGIDVTAGGRFLGNHPAVSFTGQSPIEVTGQAGNAANVYISCPTCGAGSGNFNPSGTGMAGYTLHWLGDSPLSYGWRASPPGTHVSTGQYQNGRILLGLTDGDSVSISGIPQPDGVVTGGSYSGGTLTLDRSGTLTDIAISGFASGAGTDGVITGLSYTSPDLTVTRSVGNDIVAALPNWITGVVSDTTLTGVGTTASPLSVANAARIATWAQQGNNDRLPQTKMSFGYGYVPASSGALIVVQTSNVNISIINSGYADGVFDDSYLVNTHSGQRHALVGILNSLVSSRENYAVMWGDGSHSVPLDEWAALNPGRPNDARAQRFTYYMLTLDQIPGGRARLQHLIQIEDDLLPVASSSQAGIIQPSEYIRINNSLDLTTLHDTPAITETQLMDNDAFLLDDASVTVGSQIREIMTSELDKRWLERNDSTYLDLSESFVGGTWENATAALISSQAPTSAQPTSSTAVEGYTYVTTLTTGPFYSNSWTVVRIPIADKAEVGSWRLFQDETDAPHYYPRSSWVHVKDSGAYAYYAVLIADRPASTDYEMQNLTSPYELNRAKVDVACAVQDSRIYVATKAAATPFSSADLTGADAVTFECGQTVRTTSYTGGGQRRVAIAIPEDEDLYSASISRVQTAFSLQTGGAVQVSGSNYDVWVSAEVDASDIPILIIVGDE